MVLHASADIVCARNRMLCGDMREGGDCVDE